jgi:hypothetical protein
MATTLLLFEYDAITPLPYLEIRIPDGEGGRAAAPPAESSGRLSTRSIDTKSCCSRVSALGSGLKEDKTLMTILEDDAK